MSSTKILVGGAAVLVLIAAVVLTLSGQRVWRQGQEEPARVETADAVRAGSASDANGVTPLMKAALRGDESTVRQLLDRGADANAQDRDGETALMAASYNGNGRVVRLLLDHGAQVNPRSRKGYTALDLAVKRGNDDVRKLLSERAAGH
jgi:ankyrin repeat protein